MDNFSKDITDIINSYESEEKYVESIKNKNYITHTNLISNELENIEIDEIIQFKLARQLAINLKQKAKEKYEKNKGYTPIVLEADIKCITGIFLSLLNVYRYEELLEPENIKNNINSSYETEIEWKHLSDYIDKLIENIEYKCTPFFYYWKSRILPAFDSRIIEEIESKILKYEQISEKEYMEPSELFEDAYREMIKDNMDEIYVTINWQKYIRTYQDYVLHIINKYIEDRKDEYEKYQLRLSDKNHKIDEMDDEM